MEWYEHIIVIFFSFLCVGITAGLFFYNDNHKECRYEEQCDCHRKDTDNGV